MVALALPVLLITIDFDETLPTTTFPKLQDVGFKTMEAAGATVPVPVAERVCGELVASLTSDRLPVAAPVLEGLKFTLNETLAPAATVLGTVSPLTL